MKGGGWLILAIAATGLVALVVWLMGERPGALASEGEQIRLVSLVLMMLLVGSGLLVRWRELPALVWLRYGLTWIAIGFVLIAGYSLRDEFSNLFGRMAAEIMPGRVSETAPGTVVVRAAQDGHFRIDATVDGVRLPMLVDTGASSVVLSPTHAARIGLDPRGLKYTVRTRTANGIGYAAPVRLREIRIGSISVRDVPALVNQAAMPSSLLGLSFLNRLSGYGVQNDLLTLKK